MIIDALTVAQAAQEAECNRVYITAEIRAGRLLAEKIGSQWLIDRKDFARWMANPRRGTRRPGDKKAAKKPIGF